MFGMFSCYLMWTLWRERNCRIFKDIKNSRAQLIALFSQLLFDWGCAWVLLVVTPLLISLSLRPSVRNLL